MKVSLSWLRDYVSVDMLVADLAKALTMVGLEVEAVNDRYAYLQSVLVARIVDIHPHPAADKLRVCRVDAGKQQYSVVCGAPNVEPGILAPLALAGTELPDGTILQKGMIRGIASEAMLCSEAELGLGQERSGIMVLDGHLEVGTPMNLALNLCDSTLEIGLTPNRPDCLSILGIAREVAAIQHQRIKLPDIQVQEIDADIATQASVTILAKNHCPRYAARLLDQVTVGPSPFWLQDRLLSVGMRPINNLVDITNFVMMETGQPLHAFDFDQLADRRIVVRTAEDGESFTTLDQKQRTLTAEMLMICDGQRPVAIGGVMGGLNSEIQHSTRRVLIESAYFNPISIRKTSKSLGLGTEASHRFERGVDPKGTIRAVNRAAQLMVELGRGRLFQGVIDECFLPESPAPICLSTRRTNRHLGTALNRKQIENLLTAIEFETQVIDDDALRVAPPSFRVDVTRPEDLMEEVARLAGYETVPTTFPAITASTRLASGPLSQRHRVRNMLTGFGFSEAINYSFVHRASCDRLRLDDKDRRRLQVAIVNPLSEDQAVLRTSLIPGLLETMQRNFYQQNKTLKLFEIGRAFIDRGSDRQPEEIEQLVGLWTGLRQEPSWHGKEVLCDFYDLKGVLEGVLSGLKIQSVRFTQMPACDCRYTRPGVSARILMGEETLGLIGEVHPLVLQNYDLKQSAFIFEMHLPRLLTEVPATVAATALPRYPATSRDMTLIIDKATEGQSVVQAVRMLDEPLVESIYIFDIFTGAPIPAGHKSISVRITYRSGEVTLIDQDINQLHKHITDKLISQFEATLPA
jgi:phenylalanyl-tRNA synthetase beta chain